MVKKVRTQDEITRDMLNRLRILEGENETSGTARRMINEAEGDEDNRTNKVEGTENGIAITDDPIFGQNVLTNQIQQFRTSVESGAEFSKPEMSKVSECPLIYIPKTGNLVFSGVIPCLNNLKWQFVLKTNTGNGCFIWADGMIMNKENMQILNKLYGFYCNWKEQWCMESSSLESMAKKSLDK